MKAKANLLRTLVVLAVGLLVAVAVALFGVDLRTAEPQTTAPTYYKVQDLGTIPGATYSLPTSVPYGINDSGHVVGNGAHGMVSGYYFGYYEYAVGHAFLYDGVMKDLGEGGFDSIATDINNYGHVVANFVDGNWVSHAYLYKDGKMTDLGLGGPDSQAFGINDSDQVVGESQVAGTDNYHAFLYDERATPKMKDLGLLGGTYRNYYSNSQAMGISNSGQVVGFSAYKDSNHIHAFLYDSAHGMKDLGDFSHLGGTNSYGWGINNEGQVVGMAQYVDGGEWHGFLYDESAIQKMKDLGTLGGTNSSAYAINNSGQVVGQASTSDGAQHAFLYQNEKMIDLGTRTHPDQNGHVWTLNTARGINNNGQIIVSGSRVDQNGRDVNNALLLTPISDTPPGDSQAPSAPSISSPQNNSYDKDGSFSLSGSAEAASTVELFEGTTSRGTTKADPSSGAWSIDLSGVSEGAHTYKARAIDAAGNSSSASNSVSVTVDSAPPQTNITSGPSGPTNDNTPTFSFSASDNLSEAWTLRYSYRVDGSAWSSYSFEKSVTLGGASGLSEGSHIFYVKAKDEAGNEGPAQRSFTVDTVKPQVSSTTPPTPLAGSTNVGRDTDLTASFSEQMETSTVNTNTFMLYKVNSDGSQTQITDVGVSLSSDGLKATLNPFGAKKTLLASRTKYKGVITTGTKDLAGNPLAQQTSWTFTTK